MPFNIRGPYLDAIQPILTKRDIDRAEQEFAMKKQKAVADQLLAQAKLETAQKGGDLPAPMQIANKMQELQEVANNPNTPQAEREQAVSLYNHLGQAAKTYGFDRGIQYSGAVAPMEVPGFSQATGGIKAVEAGMEQQAKKNVDAVMNPAIAGGEAAARLGQELRYGPAIKGAETSATKAAENQAEENKQLPAKAGVTRSVNQLSDFYTELEGLGAGIDPKQGAGQNVRNYLRSSSLGQVVEGAIGTEAQTVRDNIEMMRPAIINDIRKATGMGAKAMDSNVELKFYLQQATNPQRSIPANRAALSILNDKYGLGSAINADPAEVARLQKELMRSSKKDILNSFSIQDMVAPSGTVPEGVDPTTWQNMTPEEQALWSTN